MKRITMNKIRAMSDSKRVIVFSLFLPLVTGSASAMVEMRDDQLSDVTGQALLQMGKEIGQGISSDLTFYKAGLDAEVELNMNIDKLQLGCTAAAINGQQCDIDIDQLSLSGQADINGNFPNGRAATAALLTRPFFEFAIKNDHTKTLREVVGIRMSAENTKGMLTLGDQQVGSGDPGNTSGINSLSGYMRLGPTTGNAQVEPRIMAYDDYTCTASDPCTGTYAGLFTNMEGRIRITGMPLGIGNGTHNFFSETYGLFISSDDPVVVSVPATTVSGKRLTSAQLMGSATMGALDFAGQMAANVDIGVTLELNKEVTGSITGLTATVPIEQSLRYIHKINVDSAFSLSFQGQDVHWPGATEASQTGWWMAFEDEIDIGNISPEDQVPITNDVLLDALGPTAISWSPNPVPQGQSPVCNQGPSINCALHTALSTATYTSNNVTYHEVYGVECDGFSACLGGQLPVGNLNVPANLPFPLSDLKLSGQAVTPNCYGTARFC